MTVYGRCSCPSRSLLGITLSRIRMLGKRRHQPRALAAHALHHRRPDWHAGIHHLNPLPALLHPRLGVTDFDQVAFWNRAHQLQPPHLHPALTAHLGAPVRLTLGASRCSSAPCSAPPHARPDGDRAHRATGRHPASSTPSAPWRPPRLWWPPRCPASAPAAGWAAQTAIFAANSLGPLAGGVGGGTHHLPGRLYRSRPLFAAGLLVLFFVHENFTPAPRKRDGARPV